MTEQITKKREKEAEKKQNKFDVKSGGGGERAGIKDTGLKEKTEEMPGNSRSLLASITLIDRGKERGKGTVLNRRNPYLSRL
ncbi:hypothetical protein [Paenibacillus gorillae]|uniref:hypothetical protein n=1 Tax=Paenibacillus gorillae TaxID=1243662 RepID=UPI0005A8F772|nr:hypothetical protein [Paenibacillus gorillae]